MIFNKTSLIAGLVGAAFAVSSAAQAGGVPKKTAWTAYGTTSSGYAQAVAIGNMLKKHYGTNLRVIPGKNDISRMAPLRDKKAGYCLGVLADQAADSLKNHPWGGHSSYR